MLDILYLLHLNKQQHCLLYRHRGDWGGLSVHYLDSNVYVAHMGHTWVLSAPGVPHVGPMNFADALQQPGLW